MAGLKEVQDIILGYCAGKIKKASNTRWLSHDLAIQSIRKNIVCVVVALEREATERNDVTASGLAKAIKDFNFVASLLMFCDVLPPLAVLTKTWQKSDLDMTIVKESLAATKEVLAKLAEVPGGNFTQLQSLLENDWADLGVVFSQALADRFKKNIYNKYFEVLMDQMNDRFVDFPLTDAFTIFNPKTLAASTDEQIGKKFMMLVNHYSKLGNPPPICPESVKHEWKVVQQVVVKNQNATMRDILKKFAVIPEFIESVPNISKIANIALVLPFSTADCERGFSAVKRIKTCLRNRLGQESLNSLLMISLEGPSPECFDYDRAANNWQSTKRRRLQI